MERTSQFNGGADGFRKVMSRLILNNATRRRLATGLVLFNVWLGFAIALFIFSLLDDQCYSILPLCQLLMIAWIEKHADWNKTIDTGAVYIGWCLLGVVHPSLRFANV
jgi:hypothetical protein